MAKESLSIEQTYFRFDSDRSRGYGHRRTDSVTSNNQTTPSITTLACGTMPTKASTTATTAATTTPTTVATTAATTTPTMAGIFRRKLANRQPHMLQYIL